MGAVAVVALLAASQPSAMASAIIAYQNPAGDYGNQPGGNWVVGLQFTVGSTPLSVTALGAFDNNQDGWTDPVSVEIYDFNSQTIVGSEVTFSGASGPSEGTLGYDGGSRFLSVTPFTLNAGVTYMVVAAGYGTDGEQNYNAAVAPPIGQGVPTLIQATPYITVDNNYYTSGTSMVFPTTLDGGPDPRYAAGTFEFTLVPEPSTLALAGLGGLSLLLLRRQKS